MKSYGSDQSPFDFYLNGYANWRFHITGYGQRAGLHDPAKRELDVAVDLTSPPFARDTLQAERSHSYLVSSFSPERASCERSDMSRRIPKDGE